MFFFQVDSFLFLPGERYDWLETNSGKGRYSSTESFNSIAPYPRSSGKFRFEKGEKDTKGGLEWLGRVRQRAWHFSRRWR